MFLASAAVTAVLLTAQEIPTASRVEIAVDGYASVVAVASTGQLNVTGLVADGAAFASLVVRVMQETGVERAQDVRPTAAFGELFGVIWQNEGDVPEPDQVYQVNEVFSGSSEAIASAQAMFEADAPFGVNVAAAYRPADLAAAGDRALAAAVRNAEVRAHRTAASLGCAPLELQALEVLYVSDGQSMRSSDESDPWSIIIVPGEPEEASAQVSAQVRARFIAGCGED